MPSIQDIAKRSNTKMFKQAVARPLDEILPLNDEDPKPVEPEVVQKKIQKREFKKVPYRPWDDDEPTQGVEEGSRASTTIEPESGQGMELDLRPQSILKENANNVIELYQSVPIIEKNTPARMIISLYGVQRNILKFLLNNIFYEEK